MPSHYDDFVGEYRLPGIGPPRPRITTFSAQRYDPRPLRPLPTIQVYNSPPGSTHQDASRLLQNDTLQVSSDLLAFPQLSVMLLSRFVYGGQENGDVQQVVWTQTIPAIAIPGLFYRIKESYGRIIELMKRKIVDGLIVLWVPVRIGIKYLRDSASHITALFNQGA